MDPLLNDSGNLVTGDKIRLRYSMPYFSVFTRKISKASVLAGSVQGDNYQQWVKVKSGIIYENLTHKSP